LENLSSLTCILCNELVPGKEHTHNCKDEISVQIVKANLPKELPEHLKNVINNSENAFSIRTELFTTKKCFTCNENEIKSVKRLWKICSDPSDGISGVYEEPREKCVPCINKERKKAMISRKRETSSIKATKQVDRKTEDKYFQHGAHGRQCEYCAKFFDLTTDDFLAHQEFCKSNQQ